MKKKTSPCPWCKKPVRLFGIKVAEDLLEIPCDPLPTLQGTFKLVDLVSNVVEVVDPAPYQYQHHQCVESEAAHE